MSEAPSRNGNRILTETAEAVAFIEKQNEDPAITKAVLKDMRREASRRMRELLPSQHGVLYRPYCSPKAIYETGGADPAQRTAVWLEGIAGQEEVALKAQALIETVDGNLEALAPPTMVVCTRKDDISFGLLRGPLEGKPVLTEELQMAAIEGVLYMLESIAGAQDQQSPQR